VYVDLIIRHAVHMRHIILPAVACLTLPYFSTTSLKQHDFLNNVIERETCVLIFSAKLVWKFSHSKKNWKRCSLGVSSPLFILDLSRTIRMDLAVKTQLYLCNIQALSVHMNVSANYMFRRILFRSSSSWIQWLEELYNNAILSLKTGETRFRLQKMGHVYRLVVSKYMHCM
jgi:hypothetical protein